jgi:CheY-like chemotaxis protein
MEIREAADRAAGLTRQLLAFSRRQVLAPQVLDMNGIVANTEKMLRRLIGEDIEMSTTLGQGLGRIKADAGQIEQIVMNLAINARDAMPKGGKLNIETANVSLDDAYARGHISVTPGPYVMLAVTDNGMGMDAETQMRIFEPFFTTKAMGKGTGLGLATVYGIVKQSGGHIWVYSELRKGTTFKVYFPQVEGMAVNVIQPGAQCGDSRGTETVLVAEDEDSIRQLVRDVLTSKGYLVLEAKSGAEALAASHAHSGTIHLVLTDVVLPQMSGPDLAEQWALQRPETKIIYMSGYTNNAICDHGLLDKNLAFIEKPFTPQNLVKKVREVLDAEPGAAAA